MLALLVILKNRRHPAPVPNDQKSVSSSLSQPRIVRQPATKAANSVIVGQEFPPVP